MEESVNYLAASFLEQPTVDTGEITDTPSKCTKILGNMSQEKKKELQANLVRNFLDSIPEPNDIEDFRSFTERRAQHNPGPNATMRTINRINAKPVKSKRKRAALSWI